MKAASWGEDEQRACGDGERFFEGCDRLVNTQLIEQYAMSVSRWVQCETCISEYGFLAKHPTTGAAITSPYVTISQNYLKQVNQCWYQIYQIVKETDYHEKDFSINRQSQEKREYGQDGRCL